MDAGQQFNYGPAGIHCVINIDITVLIENNLNAVSLLADDRSFFLCGVSDHYYADIITNTRVLSGMQPPNPASNDVS